MKPTRPNLILLGISCLVLASIPAQAKEEAPIPRPCFVPPPAVRQGHPPRVEAPSSDRDAERIFRAAGADGDYSDRHLQGGILAGAKEHHPFKILVLLVDFEDQAMGTAFQSAREDSVHRYFQKALEHTEDMYEQMSGGLIDLEWEITEKIYRAPMPMAYYGLDDSIATREATLCQHAIQTVDPDYDLSLYDTYMLFHAGPGQEADINDDSRDQIWSVFFGQIHFGYWLQAEDAEKGIRTQDGPSEDPYYVKNTIVLPETESQDGYVFGIMGVVSHEFGHRFGLPDLYDTTARSDEFIFADSQGIGTFGLMGAGIWNANGFFPAEMEAWSKFYVGWVVPEVLWPTGGERVVTLPAIQHDRFGGAVRIPLGGDEYFLIENRIRDYNHNGKFDFGDVDEDGEFDFWEDSYEGCEFDWHLPQEFGGPDEGEPDGSGLLIWHVDESVNSQLLKYNLVNADALHKGVDLEEADGIQDLDKLEFVLEAFGDPRDSFFAPYAVAFTPDTEPNTDGYNDAYSGIWITDISGPDSTMTFRLRFTEGTGERTGDFKPGWPVDLPGWVGDFQPIQADLDGDYVAEIAVAFTREDGEGALAVFRPDGSLFFGEFIVPGGELRSDPILVDLDPFRNSETEIVWVVGDRVYAMNGTGSFLTQDGGLSAEPAPLLLLENDPGRIRLSAGDVDGRDGRSELLVATPSANPLAEGWKNVRVWRNVSGVGMRQIAAMSHKGDLHRSVTLADADSLDGGMLELVASVSHENGDYIGVGALEDAPIDGEFPVAHLRWFAGEGVELSEAVAGDLNGDGIDEIVFGDSKGYVHAMNLRILNRSGGFVDVASLGSPEPEFHNELFVELPGWPVFVGTDEEDVRSVTAASLADVDRDGRLEVLAFGPSSMLYEINYNGTINLSMPQFVNGEDRFTEEDDLFVFRFLAPLVLDVTGYEAVTGYEGGGVPLLDPTPELVLPLPDGQVRAHAQGGEPIPGWSYLGGGNQGSYPVVTDLDPPGPSGGGRSVELVTVEDVTVAIPEDIREGDTSSGILRRGRVIVRQLGAGTAAGPWPVYRHDNERSGRAGSPIAQGTEPGDLADEIFVMPNPVVGATAGFHYRARSDVMRVVVEVVNVAGSQVATLSGSIDAHTDNVLRWDLTNDSGNKVAPGLYHARYRVETGGAASVTIVPFVVMR